MAFVTIIDRGQQRPGIQDQRYGSGWNSSSLARRERSPSLELTMPMLRGNGGKACS
jgi:hypothetical protein